MMNIKSRIVLCNLLLLGLLSYFLVMEQDAFSVDFEVKFVYGEEYTKGIKSIAQVFYKEEDEIYTEANSEHTTVSNSVAILEFRDYDFSYDERRFDPLRVEADFSIIEVDIYCGKYQKVISGEEFREYVVETAGCTYDENLEKYIVTSDKPFMILDSRFVEEIKKICPERRYVNFLGKENSWKLLHAAIFFVGLFFAVLYGIVQNRKTKMKVCHVAGLLAAELLLGVGGIAAYGQHYLETAFGEVPFEQLLYHLHTPLEGVGTTTFYDLFIIFGGIIVVSLIIVFLGDYILRKCGKNMGYITGLMMLGMVYLISAVFRFIEHFGFIDYLKFVNEKTELYEEYYVDGRDVELVFPEEKRNLIFIYLESMEMTFSDTGSGGAMPTNYIPELTELAEENICFSGGEELNGAHHVRGATFTMGALVAQTAGVPINERIVSNDTLNGYWESENNYLPGVWALGDILAAEGYHQVFMIGSDGKFAGRSSYFNGHGQYEVDDYYTAIEENRIAEDYHVWWGYEDEKLYSYAKDKITELSKEDEAFNFTMLTVDTHFTNGYYCAQCGDDYDLQYSNVIACSSRQLGEFIEWCQKQEFYENTTIVISGDHLTSDSAYIENTGVSSFDRRTYFAIINPAEGCVDSDTKRSYTTMDIYPTTLAAMGVTIEGDRLGLGVNLFSGIPTLYEEMGSELNTELLKNSDFYTEKLLYAQ